MMKVMVTSIKTECDNLGSMWMAQREFSRLHYDVGVMSVDERERKTRELALALHHEVSKLVNAVNFRSHIKDRQQTDTACVLYETVDVIRYAMAICNLWDFNVDDFIAAWWDKDAYLTLNNTLQNTRWTDSPVVLVDIDDVLAKFRVGFSDWITETKGIVCDSNSPEYYFIEALSATGYSSLKLFDEFISARGMAMLDIEPLADVITRLHNAGVWIQLVTARPRDNQVCRYDTYHWLRDSGIAFDGLQFTSEKLAYATRTKFHIDGKIACAIDDGPNHVYSYTSHGITTFMPVKSYNSGVKANANTLLYDSDDVSDVYDRIMKCVDDVLMTGKK